MEGKNVLGNEACSTEDDLNSVRKLRVCDLKEGIGQSDYLAACMVKILCGDRATSPAMASVVDFLNSVGCEVELKFVSSIYDRKFLVEAEA